MRMPLAALALTLLTLPVAGQTLRPEADPSTSPPPGYSGFTAAPVPTPVPSEVSPSDRAGPVHDTGGPVNSQPFSGVPYNAFPQNGGQISPALRDTSSAWNVIPDVSK